MRIISQDSMNDFNYENLELRVTKTGFGENDEHTIRHSSYNWQDEIRFGIYSSKEKALKVMEMIREQYKHHYYALHWQGVQEKTYFYMPQDNEVE